MKQTVKSVLVPITGVIAIALVFILVLWGASWYDDFINERGRQVTGDKELAGYAILGPGWECDDSYFPVCGEDSVTYGNVCKAVNSGTSVAYRGVCQN